MTYAEGTGQGRLAKLTHYYVKIYVHDNFKNKWAGTTLFESQSDKICRSYYGIWQRLCRHPRNIRDLCRNTLLMNSITRPLPTRADNKYSVRPDLYDFYKVCMLVWVIDLHSRV